MRCTLADVPPFRLSSGHLFVSLILDGASREGIDTSHVVVHANRMRYDAEGVIAGFDGEMVHSRNKALFSKHIPPHLESTLSKGTRMIVMGDKVNMLLHYIYIYIKAMLKRPCGELHDIRHQIE